MSLRPEIVHIQRKRKAEGNFSLEYIFQDVRERLSTEFQFRVVEVKRSSQGVINRLMNIIQASRSQGRLNHVTGDIHYVTYLLRRSRTVLTILDCGFMVQRNPLKRLLLKWLWLDMPVWRSALVTTISEASKSDIVTYTGCAPDKVRVIPVAVDPIYKPHIRPFNNDCPVLLQVGTAPNKNVVRLAEALEGISCQLVIVGRIDLELENVLAKHGINYLNRINLDREAMYQAYCDCDIVTFVSTFEGFGMPIVEANCVERPVITGQTTSMPEIAGTAACIVDAFSVECIRKGLIRLMQDEAYRDSLVTQGRKNRMRFSNDEVAREYAGVYHELINALEA